MPFLKDRNGLRQSGNSVKLTFRPCPRQKEEPYEWNRRIDYGFSLIDFRGDLITQKNIEKLIKDYESCPTSQRECVIGGETFVITRHFVGAKDLNQAIAELALARADREMGLS